MTHLALKSALLVCCLFFGWVHPAFAQKDKITATLRGFIRTDGLLDTRQSVVLREAAIFLYPKPEERDAEGVDLNAQGMTTLLVLQTRAAVDFTGPETFGAVTTGTIEGEFFGVTDLDANGFRVRHAFVDMDWGHTKLLVGQYWHPMFITQMLPTFNFSSPFTFYSRNPQVRLTRKLGDVSISATAWFQSDFKSLGPDQPTSSNPDPEPVRGTQFLKNAMAPGLNLQCMLKTEQVMLGAGGDVKRLVPRLRVNGLATSEGITSLAGMVFGQYSSGSFAIKAQGLLGQNMADGTMLGGYAASAADTTAYVNITTVSGWGELSWGREIQGALFVGYTRNLGTTEDAAVYPGDPRRTARRMYAQGYNVESVLRIAPSLGFRSGPARAVAEVEYTRAVYGEPDARLAFSNTQAYENLRIALVLVYYF